jgi:hypothetical protein
MLVKKLFCRPPKEPAFIKPSLKASFVGANTVYFPEASFGLLLLRTPTRPP